jgi:hypothetical protein
MIISCGGESENPQPPDESGMQAEAADSAVTEPEVESADYSYSTVEDYARITTRDQLVSEFGEDNLTAGETWYAEGTVRADHTILTNPQNGQVIKYLWDDDGNSLSALEVGYYVFDDDYSVLDRQVVYSECGIHTGMSLQELREWNGEDFDFFGFGWDYEGGIMAEEGSRIAECPVLIKLGMYLEAEDPEEYMELSGDQIFNSSDGIVQGAPIVVDMLTYYP